MADRGVRGQCRDCGRPFVVTAGARLFYASKDISMPSRCPRCREIRREALELERSLAAPVYRV